MHYAKLTLRSTLALALLAGILWVGSPIEAQTSSNEDLVISPQEATLKTSIGTVQFDAFYNGEEFTDEVTWQTSTSAAGVLTLGSPGEFRATSGSGTYAITAKYQDPDTGEWHFADAEVNIVDDTPGDDPPPPNDLVILPNAASLQTGESVSFTAYHEPNNCYQFSGCFGIETVTQDAQWTVSDYSVLSRQSKGSFKSARPGEVTVTATYQGLSQSVPVIVSSGDSSNPDDPDDPVGDNPTDIVCPENLEELRAKVNASPNHQRKKAPACPAIEELWGELRPVDPAPLPEGRDSTSDWTGHEVPDSDLQLWKGMDIENNYLFTAFSSGFEIWDIGQNPEDPQRLSYIDGWEGWRRSRIDHERDNRPAWTGNASHYNQMMTSVDVPNGNDDLAVVGARGGMTFIADISDKRRPKVLYQYGFGGSWDVYATEINGRYYAFVGRGGNMAVLDMTAAQQLDGFCSEWHREGNLGQNCPGVFVAKIGNEGDEKYVHGVDTYIVTAGGGLNAGLSLWDASDPVNPQLIVEEFDSNEDPAEQGVALWKDGERYYLAARFIRSAKTFDVTECLTSGCDSFRENELWSIEMPFRNGWQYATFSRSNGRPMVHFGAPTYGDSRKTNMNQEDFLYDMSDPTNPELIIPRDENGNPKTITVDGVTVDYFSSYYYWAPTGFMSFSPIEAMFNGNYLYRVNNTTLDVHKWGEGDEFQDDDDDNPFGDSSSTDNFFRDILRRLGQPNTTGDQNQQQNSQNLQNYINNFFRSFDDIFGM